MLDVVTELAWRQHGAFSTTQAIARGVTSTWLSNHSSAGTIRRDAPAVYVLACAPATIKQRHMVHLLAAGDGAMATSDSGLALWCPELVLPRKPVLTVPRNCGYTTDRATLVRSRDLHLAKPTVVDGIPTVGVARALLDAAVGRTPDEVVARINACQRHSSLAVGALVEALSAHARSGRPGITTFREALRILTRAVPDSEFERLVVRDLVAAGVPEPRLHHVVRLPGEPAIELDLDWPGCLLDVELDGADHFVRRKKAGRDRARDRLLGSVGYFVPRYTWDDYIGDRDGMIAEIARFVDERSGSGVSPNGAGH